MKRIKKNNIDYNSIYNGKLRVGCRIVELIFVIICITSPKVVDHLINYMEMTKKHPHPVHFPLTFPSHFSFSLFLLTFPSYSSISFSFLPSKKKIITNPYFAKNSVSNFLLSSDSISSSSTSLNSFSSSIRL